MSLISAIDISFQAGSKPLFEGLSFHINSGDRVALVGHNGCGKSTLIRLITGEHLVDSGRLVTQRGLKVGLVEQFLPLALEGLSVTDAVASCLQPDLRVLEAYKVEALLFELGFDTQLMSQHITQLSGGQKNLVLFARAIVQEPELLLLDEPGNHMDSKAMFFLKRYLCQANVPAFLMISHDRDLLDSVTDRTLWLRDERCYNFNQPYSKAKVLLQEQDIAAQKTRESEEKEIAKLKVSAKRLATWGKVYDNEDLARKAKSMEKRIDKLAADVTFVSKGSGLTLSVDTELLKSKQLFVLENEAVLSPDGRHLFSVDELSFKPGDRVALLGINGSGKTSCINLLLENYAKDTGEQTTTRFNPNVRIGYFDQELAQFNASLSLVDWVRNYCTASEDSIKRALISCGFPYLEHDRRVNVLSGGERARLLLMTFQLDQPNLLIMDEPTNHIDLQGKEELEIDLVQQGVSLIFTSHDQRFIENIATRYWWIHNGSLTEIHDPAPYFLAMSEETGYSSIKSENTPKAKDEKVAVCELNEELLLARICALEALLEEDNARKLKFQKPKKQQEWRAELDELLAKL